MNKILFVLLFFIISTIIYSQNPCPGTPTVTYEGKTYNTVQIKKQCWLKENLDVGTMLKGSQAETNNGVIEKYCYKDDPNNCKIYGGLYNWAETVQYKNGTDTVTKANPPIKGKVQGICPPGWHIPNKAESYQLGIIAHVGEANEDANVLKAIGQGSGIFAGTNTSGFSAMIYKYSPKDYGSTFFWTSEEISYQGNLAEDFHILGKAFYYQASQYKYQRMHVRCLKD